MTKFENLDKEVNLDQPFNSGKEPNPPFTVEIVDTKPEEVKGQKGERATPNTPHEAAIAQPKEVEDDFGF